MKNLSNFPWNALENAILPFLTVFKQATNTVQQDCATLLHLNEALNAIQQEIYKIEIKTMLNVSQSAETRFKFDANEIFNMRMQQFVLAKGLHYAFWAVSLLTDMKTTQWLSSFGDSAKDYNETLSWIANWGAELLLFYPKHFEIRCERQKTALISMLNCQIAEFESGLGTFNNKQQYLRDFTQQIHENSVKFDPKQREKREINWILFWNRMKRTVPELSCVAICLLSLGISEAACERSFSIQQLTHSKIRNRLNDKIVEAEMVLRYNKQMLDEILDLDNNFELSDSD